MCKFLYFCSLISISHLGLFCRICVGTEFCFGKDSETWVVNFSPVLCILRLLFYCLFFGFFYRIRFGDIAKIVADIVLICLRLISNIVYYYNLQKKSKDPYFTYVRCFGDCFQGDQSRHVDDLVRRLAPTLPKVHSVPSCCSGV